MNYGLAKHELNACVLGYVKNESSLLTMTSTLISLVCCEVLYRWHLS
jgi:hypothetical protein